MTIVHEHGINVMEVRFCRCYHTTGARNFQRVASEEPLQLIDEGLWPASWTQPTTAFTTNGLRNHHLLTLQSQMSAYDYCKYLARSTDNVSPEAVPVRVIEELGIIIRS